VLVPAYHDPTQGRWSRLDRHRPLVACLGSIVEAVDSWRTGTKDAFDEVEILLIDDGSPGELSTLLPAPLREAVDVMRLHDRRGQGAALNAALVKHAATAYAITDSDCVVAPDWITTIAERAGKADGTDGTAGPPWRHQPTTHRKAAWLTRHESMLVRYCTARALDAGSVARIDCRNLWLRAEVVERLGRDGFFAEDAGAALSGITSRRLESAGVRLGFDDRMIVRHEALTSVRGVALTYFSRGATSDLATHYAAGHRSLWTAFLRTYFLRHFVGPIRTGVNPAYVLLAHGSYWCGLAWRRRQRQG
jgi:glycosyltransferase involved in cell wall biosynthesis